MSCRPLSETHPELAAEAVGWDPATVTCGSEKVRLWRCPQGHEWTAKVKTRVYGRQCPVCRNRAVVAGFNDLETTHPELAAEAVGWDPTRVTAGSSAKLHWRCSSGHEWQDSVAHRTARGDGCPYCSGRRVLAGHNDLATIHPELAAESVGWDPTTVSRGSHRALRWRCGEGHEWSATPNARSRGNGCPFCSNKRVLAGFNDLATTHPELAAEAVGWDPSTVTYGSMRRVKWRCSSDHFWTTSVKQRTSEDATGCPYCAGKKVLAGYNDLASQRPDLAAEVDVP